MRDTMLAGSVGAIVCFAGILFPGTALETAQYIRGDADASGGLEITDGIRVLGYLFLGNPESLDCEDASDAIRHSKPSTTTYTECTGLVLTREEPLLIDLGVTPYPEFILPTAGNRLQGTKIFTTRTKEPGGGSVLTDTWTWNLTREPEGS